MFGSLLILLLLPILDTKRTRGNKFSPLGKINFWLLPVIFFMLGWLGGNHPEIPYIEIGQIFTTFYFLWFIFLVPLVGVLENTLVDIALPSFASAP